MRRVALRAVLEVAEAEGALWLRPVLVDGRVSACEAATEGSPVPKTVAGYARAGGIPWVDHRRPLAAHARRFVHLSDLAAGRGIEAIRQTRYQADVLDPEDLTDHLRLLVYAEGAYVGWIGALRKRGQPLFGRRDVARIQRYVPAISSALLQAHVREQAASPEEACDLLVDAVGTIELASRSAQRWLGRPGAREHVRQAARAIDAVGDGGVQVWGGVAWRWTRLEGPRGARYLLHASAWHPPERAVDAALSDRQLEVARMASEGHSVADMARALGRSPETIRTHLRQIYTRLGVSTRAELARVLVGG